MGSPYLYRVETFSPTGFFRRQVGTDIESQGAGVFLLYENLGEDDGDHKLGYDGANMHHWIFCKTALADPGMDSDPNAKITMEGSVDKVHWYHLQESSVNSDDRTVIQTDARSLSGMTYPYTRLVLSTTSVSPSTDIMTAIDFQVYSFRNVDVRRTDTVIP